MFVKRQTLALVVALSASSSMFFASPAMANGEMPMPGEKLQSGNVAPGVVVPAEVAPTSPEGVLRTLRAHVTAEDNANASLAKAIELRKQALELEDSARSTERAYSKSRRDASHAARQASAKLKKPADVSTAVISKMMVDDNTQASPEVVDSIKEEVAASQERYNKEVEAADAMHSQVATMYANEKALSKARRDAAAARRGVDKTVREIAEMSQKRKLESQALSSIVDESLGYKGTLKNQVAQFETDLSTLPEESRLRLTLADMKAMVAETCQEDDTEKANEYRNGRLGMDVLCAVPGYKGHALRPNAARDFAALAAAFERQFDKKLTLTDSYRTYAEQVSVKRRKPHLAAKPGTSNHGLGLAVDLGSGVQKFSSEEHDWMVDNAHLFRFYHPDWAQKSGSKPEPWHWEHVTVQLDEEAKKVSEVASNQGN